jgi:drug/metabolite transporter (DMT)-like permease
VISSEGSTVRHALAGHGAILLTAVLWGSLIPLLGILLSHFDAYALSAFRYGIATLLLAPALLLGGGGWLRGLPIGKVFLLGFLGIAGFTTCYTLGVALSDPGTAIVISAATPVISAVFATIVYRIPFEKGAGLAFLLAALGGVIASLGRPETSAGLGFRGGELLFIAAGICWAWYSIHAQKWLGQYRQSHLTAVTMVTGSLGLWLVFMIAAGLDAAHVPEWPSHDTLLLLAFVAVGSTLIGILCWNFAVARLGVIIPSLYLSMLPAIGMLTAAALGTPPTTMQLVGGVIVTTGIAQLYLRRLPQARPTARS